MKSLSPLPFPGKLRLLFAIFGIILPGNTVESQVKGEELKFDKYYLAGCLFTIPTFNLFRQKKKLPNNLVPRVTSFDIFTKSILKSHVTTVHLLQCTTNSSFVYVFEGEIYANWEASITIKKKLF